MQHGGGDTEVATSVSPSPWPNFIFEIILGALGVDLGTFLTDLGFLLGVSLGS